VQASTLQSLLPDIARSAAITVGSTLFQTIIIYIVGSLMGGLGSFIRFGRVMAAVQILLYLILAAAFGVLIGGLFSGNPNVYQTTAIIAMLLLLLGSLGGLGIQAFAAGIIAGLLGLFNG
jgi:hypothetical protein